MDAAHRLLTLFVILTVALLAAAPGFAADTLTVNTTSIGWTSSVTASQVSVGSTGSPITFTTGVTYGEAGAPAWLTVSADSSTTPANVLLGIGYNPYPSFGAGPFHATVKFTGGGSTASVVVTYSPTSTGGPGGSLSVTPSPLTLERSGAGSALGYLMISSGGGADTVFGVTVSPTAGWALSVDRTSGVVGVTSPTMLTVTAQTASSTPSAYTGTVTISPAGQTPINVTVNFVVSGGGGSVADTDLRLSYGGYTSSTVGITANYKSGDAAPADISIPVQSVSRTHDVYALYRVTADSPSDWIYAWQYPNAPPEYHYTSQAISIGFRRVSTLPSGIYHATFEFAEPLTDGRESSDRALVNVTLYVNTDSTDGSLTVSPSNWNVSSLVEGPSQTQTFSVAKGYNVTVGEITSDQAWLTSGGITNGALSATVNPAGLADGAYNGHIIISYSDNGTAAQTSLAVKLTVGSGGGGAGGGQLVAPAQLSFAYQTGTAGGDITPQYVVVPGSDDTYSASVDQSWVLLDYIGGSPYGGPLPGRLRVTVLPVGLAAQTDPYTANIRIVTQQGEAVVPVRLLVTSSPVLQAGPGTLVFGYPGGEGTPQSTTVIASNRAATAITATAPATAPWLHVATAPGAPGSTLTVSVDDTGMTTGTYGAVIQVTGTGMANSPMALPVVFMVNGGGSGQAATLTINPAALSFKASSNGAAQQKSLSLTRDSGGTSFTAVARAGSWLSLSANNLTAPATLQVIANPAGLTPGTYTDYIDLNGGTQTVTVTFEVTEADLTGNVSLSPALLTFSHQMGASAPAPQQFTVLSATSGIPSVAFSAAIQGGTAWLSMTPTSGATPTSISVSVNPAGLSAGSHTAIIRIQAYGGSPVDLPVTLTISTPGISVDTTDLTFTYQAGDSSNPAPKTVQVVGAFGYTAQAASTGNWLTVWPATGTGPATLTISVNPSGLTPGATYQGTVLVSGANGSGSATINVTLRVQAPAPTLAAVVNAASYSSESISPGEIVTLFGTNLGPTTPVGLKLDANGKVATSLGEVKVFFSGFEAPITFASANQVNVVVPYEVKSYSSVNVYTKFMDRNSNSITVPVTASAPGIFTADASGSGPGAVLNADYGVNGPGNPTSKGSTVMVYMTGEGETSPSGVTGKVTVVQNSQPYTPKPLGNIAVLVDGQPARVDFAGEAPGFVSGLLQLNVVIPDNARSGNLPIVVRVGTRSTQDGVTVSVK